MRFIILLSALLACAAASAGDVYKWKDKDGRIHYGDKPKSGEAQTVIVAPTSGGEPSKTATDQATRDAECKAKTAQLESWRKAPTMSEVDNLGRTREYTAAERQQFLDMTQAKVDALCTPPAPPEAAGTFPPPEEKYEPVQPPPEEPG